MTSKTGSGFAAIAAVAMGCVASPVLATPVPGQVLITLNASSEIGRGSLEVGFEPALYNAITHTYSWVLTNPVIIFDTASSMPLLTLLSCKLTIVDDPSVDLEFHTVAQNATTDVQFMLASLPFPTI